MLLANRIRNIREAKKLTQTEIADRCNMSTSTYGKIERKAGSSSFDTLTKVANALGVNISFLVDISNPNYLP
jgi:transcriptional regulator with XRE-family HTH domain